MTISPLTLRFADRALESEFRAEYARSALRAARATTILIIVLYVGYAVIDLRAGTAGAVWPLRLAVVAVLATNLALTWHPVFERVHSELLALGGLAGAFGILGMMATVGDRMEVAFYPGIGLAIIGTLTLFRIRFPVALVAALVMLAAYVAVLAGGDYPYDNAFMASLYLATCVLIGGFACWNLETYAREGFLARLGLERERERSERLLLNVLPAPIAERLKTDPAPIADRYAEASVLFADIVGFTAMSSAMRPEDLVKLLNELFTRFDQVSDRHGLEKIKTIGDAYMAVCGVPVPRPDHLERIADAALEMRDLVGAGVAGGGPPLAVRIGIDTGPVVAGVIGERKFIFDLWGDPVTMASRMESTGVPSAIQVTARARERLAGRYALTTRGEIEVKGRGRMATYLLDRRTG
ncbi:MAG TPA: adenylate/guanylate cyclase domain-containing protein [Gemmatimonadota bacterium]